MFDSSVNHEENNGGMSYQTLIPVRMGEIGGEAVQLCNARDLHICLGVGSRFNDWIARRIAEYGFVEGQDFYSEMSKKAAGRKGRGSVEYSISVDMAKELAMVERTEAGRRIRRYFIACEKALRQIAPDVAAECLRKALNPQQQFKLKEKVDNKVACLAKARQRAGYHELWSSLKSRHQVAQYRDIAQAEFDDACQYVESYSWEGEWLQKQEKAGSFSDLIGRPLSMVDRWIVSLDATGQERYSLIPFDACVMTHQQMIKAMVTPGELLVSRDQMFEFMQAGLENLKMRSDHQVREIKRMRAVA